MGKKAFLSIAPGPPPITGAGKPIKPRIARSADRGGFLEYACPRRCQEASGAMAGTGRREPSRRAPRRSCWGQQACSSSSTQGQAEGQRRGLAMAQ